MKKVLIWSSVITVLFITFIFFLLHRGAIHDDKYPIADCDYMLPQNLQDIVQPALKEKLRFDPTIENTAFDSLLISNEPIALEARIALLAYYIGEHSGHELIESIISQHKTAAPLIEKYQRCRPQLRSEWQIGTFGVSGAKYSIYTEMVSSNNW